MTPKTQYQRELDQIEALCMGRTVAEYKAVEQVWIHDGMAAALQQLARFKAAHPLDAPIAALRAAYDAGDGPAAASAIKQMITIVQAPTTATTKPIHTSTRTDASPTSVNKQTKVASLDAILAGGVAARARSGGM